MTTSTPSSPDVLAIWAEALNKDHRWIIGDSKTNGLPWPHNAEDLKHFRDATRDRVLIMGRKTFEALPEALKTPMSTFERPLVVLSDTAFLANAPAPAGYWNVIAPDTPKAAIAFASAVYPTKAIAVIGGTQVFNFMLPVVDRLSVTMMRDRFDGDVLAPAGGALDRFHVAFGQQIASGLVYTYTRKENSK